MLNTQKKVTPMQAFTLYTADSAPEQSRPTLQMLEQRFGFLPNVMATMAANPVLLNGFAGSFASFHGGSLDECEKQILLLTNAVSLKCPWTVAAHSTFALEDGVAPGDVEAIRLGNLPLEPKYAALSATATSLMHSHGHVGEAELLRFTAAGYALVQIFEVITSLGISTMAATITNLAKTPVEARFQAQAWSVA